MNNKGANAEPEHGVSRTQALMLTEPASYLHA